MHPFEHTDEQIMRPIDVHIVGSDTVERQAPDKSVITSFNLQGAAAEKTTAQRALSRSPKRAIAHVYIYSGFLNNNTAGFVMFGSREAVQVGQGAPVPCGASLEWQGQESLWFAGDGVSSLTVVVIDEWYL